MKRQYTYLFILSLLVSISYLGAQSLDNITDVVLTFTPESGGEQVSLTATDEDGSGSGAFILPSEAIALMESTSYELAIELRNSIDNEDLTVILSQNSERYQFFFSFAEAIIESPTGTGNISEADGLINYDDLDANSLPVGLQTTWQTACFEGAEDGEFRVVLRDLGSNKSTNSLSTDGEMILDLTFGLEAVQDPDAPPCENEEEIITDVVLTWTPTNGGNAIVARAQDPDGEGPLDLQIVGEIELDESTDYTLAITLSNEVEGEDITAEIMEEDDAHQFYFAWTEGLFAEPHGDGNIDGRDGEVVYNDMDENGLPVGLSTSWTTSCTEEAATGTFRLILKHQPGIKSSTSTAVDGGTDLDLSFTVNLVDDPNAPPCENEEEIITDVVLTWTPANGGNVIVARAQDPDGEGPLDLQIVDEIELDESTDYTLAITLSNEVEGEDITAEIMEEDDAHQFYFAWTEGLFAEPHGDGNIDGRDGEVNYNDMDENGLPVGLSTSWTTSCTEEATAGTFRLILKHQPDIKSSTSTADDGGTDLDLTFNVNLVDDPNAPPCENEEEIITDVILTWRPMNGGSAVVARAQDPDGEGPLDLQIIDNIALDESTDYTLAITLSNEVEGEDITAEIMEEDDVHQFYFAWSEGIFETPSGDGNIDQSTDSVGYLDFDDNGLPVGLNTSWKTASSMVGGTFRVVLKHQPDIKSSNSTVEDGGTDLDLTFDVNLSTSTHLLNGDYDLRVYPNPASSMAFVNIPDQLAELDMNLSVFNVAGQRVLRQAVPRTGQEQVSLHMSSLSEGVYLLILEDRNGKLIQRQKLVKIQE